LALDRLGDPLDPSKSGVPRCPDGVQLGDCAGELRLVHLVALLSAHRSSVDKTGLVKDAEVFGHRLAADRELLSERRRGASTVDKQQVEHSAPHRVSDRRPQIVVNDGVHGRADSDSA
jgi:hypothetical protein